MSKRSRTRHGNVNTTNERRRRQERNSYKFWETTTLKDFNRDTKLFDAQDELEKDYQFKNIEKVAKLCPGITSAKAYQTTVSPSTVMLVVKGREGVCPGVETIDWVGICVSAYMPKGVDLRVVGDINSKSRKTFTRDLGS